MLFFSNKQLLLVHQVITVPTTALCILPVQTVIYLLVAVCQPAPISGTTLGRVKIHSFLSTGEATLLPLGSWQTIGMV